LCIIFLCIRLVIVGASPLRTASNNLKQTFDILPETKCYSAPSRTAIKRWLQKVGYHKLTRPKVIASDWMVLIDASIQMGEQKCLLVLGWRGSDFPKNRALKLEDLEVLSLRVISNLNSELVTQVLKKVSSIVGAIECICSDRGSDMVRGVKDFQIISPKTKYIHDTALRVANFLKSILEKSTPWKKFREQTTQARRKMQNSLVAGAIPPSPRTKARFMNVDSLIQWASDILILLDNGVSTEEFDIKELKKYLEWLPVYRDEIIYWNSLVFIGATARQLIREKGIYRNIDLNFEQAIGSVAMGARELSYVDQISSFLAEQSQEIEYGRRYVGSTEVLESLFGKLKHMEHEQKAFSFTSLVLAAMACVGPTDEKTVEEAITSIKLSQIDQWSNEEIGKSLQSKRTKIKKIVNELKVKVRTKLTGILEGEVVGF